MEKRIKLEHASRRALPLQYFETSAHRNIATEAIADHSLQPPERATNTRIISPQQLLFYRDNWYVDAWCHLRNGIRSFSIDAIRHAELVAAPTIELPQPELQEYFKKSYGIFSGTKIAWAKLRFTPERARWIYTEQWHLEQKSRFDKNGYYCLGIPYSDDRELLMDILKHGTEVEVMAPKALRGSIRKLLESALAKYKI